MDHVATYITHRQLMGELAPSSARVIAAILRRFTSIAGDDPTAWTAPDVAAFTHGADVAANTARMRLATLRRFCRWLRDRGIIDADPTAMVARVRVPDGRPRDLTDRDVAALARVLPDDRARLIVALMVQCGLRVGDVCRVQVGDVDRQRRRLHVRAKGGRGGPTHWVPIPTEAWTLVASRLLEMPPTGPLIRSDRFWRSTAPLSANHVGRLVRTWMRSAGIKVEARDGMSSHALRHTCAQDMLDAGATVDQVRHVLGHRTEATTRLYLRRDPVGLAAAMEGRRYLAAS